MVNLTAIIPATDRPQTLERCLAAIDVAIEPPEELIVIEEPASIGPAAARNLGARRARGDVLVFVDSDVAVRPEAFAKIRGIFDADAGLAATFGSYDDDPGGDGLVSDFRNLLHHHVHQQGAGPATTFWAGLGAVRRADFFACGCFDEERFPEASIEDIELGMRLVQRGRRILLDPTLQGKHLKRWTVGSMIRTDLFNRGVPWVELLLERRSGSTALNLGWRHRTSVLVSLGLAAGVVTRRPALAATSLGAILLLNRSFYVLLVRRGGPRLLAAGVGLHVVHHLLSAAAVPVGLAAHLGAGSVPPRTRSE
jgi:GT2 family glycosyltransferase